MKKFFASIVKLVTVLVVLGGLVCAVVTYWDKIICFMDRMKALCKGKHTCHCSSAEHEDYADWDE